MVEFESQNDGDLLGRFAADGDQDAFAGIVQRHGAMVHAVCLRILSDHHAAQDVAQAAFLALARHASKLRRENSVGGWLHVVAWRMAVKSRVTERTRREREEATMREHEGETQQSVAAREQLRGQLDHAIGALPEHYRLPFVLFHLEERSLEQTAQRLGLNINTTGTRLARAREILRRKLVRRGVTVGSVGALTALLSAEAGAAVLPATFVSETVKIAGLAAAGKLAAGVGTGAVSANVAALTKGACNMLFWSSVKTAAVTAVATVVVAGTAVVVAQQTTKADRGRQAPTLSPPVGGAVGQAPAADTMPTQVVEGKIVKGLQLALSADKTETAPEGGVKLTLALVNRGTEPIKYLQYPRLCGPWLKVTGPDGKAIQCVRDPRAPLVSVPAPNLEHVKELARDAKWEHVECVAWTVLDPPVEDRNRITGKVIRRYDGCGWDIRKPGRYTIVVSYGPIEDARKINAKHQAGVWDGAVESNPVVFTVKPAEPLVDQVKAAKADTVVRGVLAPVETPEQSGWPTYTLPVADCYKAPPDRSVKAGQTITVKTIKEIKGVATFYLVWDDRQGLYRLADPYGDGGFSQ